MRVAYICVDPGIPVFGTKGASVHVQEIVRGFLQRGDDVTLYCTRRGERPPDDLRDVRVVEHRVPPGDASARERQTAQAAHALAQRALTDGCDLVYERFSLFSTAAAVVAGRGVPTIVEVNAPLIDEQRAHRVLADLDGARRAARTAFAAASLVVCVSDPVAAWARASGAERVAVVPNGVNTRRIRPAPADARGPYARGPYTVGFVGTLKPWHGVETLVDAMGLLRGDPPCRLLVIGDGPAAPALRAQAARQGVDVHFAGAVAPDDVPALLATLDVGVAPYPAAAGEHYFSPLKVYEYLAAGLPVVASRIGQIPQIVTHGRTGLLTDPGDAADLARALAALRDDPRRRARMGRVARADAVEHHDWHRVLDRILRPIAEGMPA